MTLKRYVLDKEQLGKWVRNIGLFTAPVLAIFFYQLSQGVTVNEAVPVALFALWGLLADYFKKLK